MPVANLFDGIPAQLPEEISQTLLSASCLRIERIVSRGHASPDGFWYDQSEHEWLMLIAGEAGVEIEGKPVCSLRPGDVLLLPAHQRHRVAWTSPDAETIWLAVFYKDDSGC